MRTLELIVSKNLIKILLANFGPILCGRLLRTAPYVAFTHWELLS